MLGINARVEDLREQLIQDINRARLPVCVIDYVLTEILNDVRIQRASEVQNERKRYKEETTPAPGEVPVPKKGTVNVERGGNMDDNDNAVG